MSYRLYGQKGNKMKIIVVNKERQIKEIKDIEFFDYDSKTKEIRYFSDYKFYTLVDVEIMHVEV